MTSQLKRKATSGTTGPPNPATKLIEQAFRELQQTVTPNDARVFSNTTLEDVRKAARDIEKQLEARQSLCNMRRLEPFFEGLQHYSKPLEVLCNGTPYLPWLWAPVKLILQVSSDFLDVFKQVIEAYREIAETLPRFDRLGEAFSTDSEFQQVLAVFYIDILRFHKEAYKLVKRNAWNIFFRSTWGMLQRRFRGIIADMRKHAELVEREAYVNNISAAQHHHREIKQWRDQELERISREEKHHTISQFQAVTSWLEYRDSDQSDILDSISSQHCPGTSDWALKNAEIASWLRNENAKCFLLLVGKPGSGKSVLMSKLTQFGLAAKNSLFVYHFCNYRSSISTQYGHILRSLVAQLLRNNDDLIAFVYSEYLLSRKAASPSNLEQLVPLLLSALSNEPSKTIHVKILLDGIDECEEERQQKILGWLQSLSITSGPRTVCKVLISGRDTPRIVKFVKKRSSVSLSQEHASVKTSIRTYVCHRFSELRSNLESTYVSKADIDHIEQTVVERSNGMFLWARLVSDILSSDVFFDVQEMCTAVETMPKELSAFYRKILNQIAARKGEAALAKMRVTMGWIAFAQRQLRLFELQSALAFYYNLERLPPSQILDLCKPLVELGLDGSLAFVHSSVQEFLISSESGPFLRPEIIHMCQTLSCTRALLSGLSVFDPSYSDVQRSLRVVRGLHGLHVYATEFWIEHLLRFAEHQSAFEASHVTSLMNLVKNLCMRFTSKVQETIREDSDLSSDPRLSIFLQQPIIYHSIKTHILRRGQTSSEDNEAETNDAEAPPAILKTTLEAYQQKLQALFHVHSIAGITSEQLAYFKKVFRTSAFTCRRQGCGRSTSGFENDELRCDHERAHTRLLRCTIPECHYSLPFLSSRALKAHMATACVPGVPKTKPKRIRREQPLSTKLLPKSSREPQCSQITVLQDLIDTTIAVGRREADSLKHSTTQVSETCSNNGPQYGQRDEVKRSPLESPGHCSKLPLYRDKTTEEPYDALQPRHKVLPNLLDKMHTLYSARLYTDLTPSAISSVSQVLSSSTALVDYPKVGHYRHDQNDEELDADEPKYCYCGGASYGEMIACDNKYCPRKWFHLTCTELIVAPTCAKWYCNSQDCKASMILQEANLAANRVMGLHENRVNGSISTMTSPPAHSSISKFACRKHAILGSIKKEYGDPRSFQPYQAREMLERLIKTARDLYRNIDGQRNGATLTQTYLDAILAAVRSFYDPSYAQHAYSINLDDTNPHDSAIRQDYPGLVGGKDYNVTLLKRLARHQTRSTNIALPAIQPRTKKGYVHLDTYLERLTGSKRSMPTE